MRKIVFGVIGLCLLALVSFGGYFVYTRYIAVTYVPADMATRPWVEHHFQDGSVFVDFPKPLNNEEKNVTSVPGVHWQSNLGDGLYVYAASSEPATRSDVSLDYMADGYVEINRKSHVVISSKKTPTLVLGESAIDLEMVTKKKWRTAGMLRTLFFRHNGSMLMIMCNSEPDQPAADAVWERIKKSIRTQSGAVPPPNADSVAAPNAGSVPASDGGITRGVPQLPKGLTRRPK